MHAYLLFCQQKNYLEIQSHDAYFSKFSWGSMPPDPPRSSMLHECASVTQINVPPLKWKTLFFPLWVEKSLNQIEVPTLYKNATICRKDHFKCLTKDVSKIFSNPVHLCMHHLPL